MEPNKLENEFRSKLNQREIMPTPHAWDRLDAMLNESETKGSVPVKKLNWLYIAAGFIGLLLLASMFFRQKSEVIAPENQVVVEESASGISSPESEAIAAMDSVKENTQETDSPQKDPVEKTPVSNAPAVEKKIHSVISGLPKARSVEKNSAVANSDIDHEKEKKSSVEINQTIITPANPSVDGQIADAGQKANRKPSIKVDAESLLSQVDGELELSFREKALKAIGKKYKNVKGALANRNQE